jgi:G3E family GTPase
MSDHATIPVTLLTGFLGSGKTTVLNHLLASPDLSDCAVLINEYGETAIDHLLVRRLSEDMVVLDSGCLCCSVLGDLVTSLRDLFRKRVLGEVPEFRRVLIETSGLADPAPIIHTLMSDVILAARYRLDGVICTIDAVNGGVTLDHHRESVKQAAMADRLVLTKLDITVAEVVQSLRQRLAALNPTARQLTATRGVIDPADLLDCGLWQADGRRPDVARWLNDEALLAKEAECGPGCSVPHHSHGHHTSQPARHDDAVSSFVLSFDQPLSWEPFALALEVLLEMRGENLLRVKGIVNVVESLTPLVIHGVQHLFHPPTTLAAWPDQDRRSRIVFITRDLSRQAVEQLLEQAVGQQTVKSGETVTRR